MGDSHAFAVEAGVLINELKKRSLYNLYRILPFYCIPISVFLQIFPAFFVHNIQIGGNGNLG